MRIDLPITRTVEIDYRSIVSPRSGSLTRVTSDGNTRVLFNGGIRAIAPDTFTTITTSSADNFSPVHVQPNKFLPYLAFRRTIEINYTSIPPLLPDTYVRITSDATVRALSSGGIRTLSPPLP